MVEHSLHKETVERVHCHQYLSSSASVMKEQAGVGNTILLDHPGGDARADGLGVDVLLASSEYPPVLATIHGLPDGLRQELGCLDSGWLRPR